MTPEQILAQLVGIPSVSSRSNAPILDLIEALLKPLRWHSRRLSYHDAAGTEKANLLVSPMLMGEHRVDVELAVVCHTDTVPFSAEWKDATNLQERNGILHGCGACDVKGFLSSMLAAALALDTSVLRRAFCFAFTADEEIGCRGARFLAETKALRARYAIVGEPTSLIPSHAGKGYCLASVTVSGMAGHSAYPEAGASAILAAARLLTSIEALAVELMGDRDETFSPPFTTLNVGEIHGGSAKNVVPAECMFLLEWRPIPSQMPDLVVKCVRALARALEQELGPTIHISIDVSRQDAGFATSPASAVVQALLAEPSAPVQTIAFGTEAPWMSRLGAETVVVGPGSMLTAHSPRECVPIVELTQCTRMLEAAIVRLCS